MKILVTYTAWAVLVGAGALTGCASGPKSADVSENVRKTLDEAGLRDVTVSQDRDKGVVTLGGHVPTEAQRARAEALVKPIAAGQVVAVGISVVPAGGEQDAKAIQDALDMGIEKNLDAAFIKNKMDKDVKYAVRNALVTLTGDLDSEARRAAAEKVAAAVPNVKQVVNTVQIKNRKATSSK